MLFIGNSYTFVNDLPATVAKIAKSLGNTLVYDMSAIGGYTLMQHAGDQNTLAKIASRKWDYVVLQEQSQIPAVYNDTAKAQFIMPYAKQLDTMTHQANPAAKTVVFETWGRENGHSQNNSVIPEVSTYAGDQARINTT